MTRWQRHPDGWRVWLADPSAADLLGRGNGPSLAALAAGAQGEEVTRSRSSWVYRFRFGATDCHGKTYVYPSARDRVRGWFRNTLFAPSRARREAEAARWLLGHGFVAPRPLLVAEQRRFRGLRVAVLVTATLDGERLDQALASGTPTDRAHRLVALAAWVDALHAAGFRDRNLDLRNILLLPGPHPRFAKLDSPRFVVVESKGPDALSRADIARLTASLAAIGMEWPAPPPTRKPSA